MELVCVASSVSCSHKQLTLILTLLHSERPKLYGVLAFLCAVLSRVICKCYYIILSCKYLQALIASLFQVKMKSMFAIGFAFTSLLSMFNSM